MDNLEIKKKELELKRVELAKEELAFKIEEKLSEIQRIKDNIVIQDVTIDRLKNELKQIRG
jgi:peptidoglycan hydrolase CwlO-like protein